MARGWCARRFPVFFTIECEIERFEMDVDDLPGVAVDGHPGVAIGEYLLNKILSALPCFAGGELIELAAHKVTADADYQFQKTRFGICIAECMEGTGHNARIPAVISRPSHSARDPRDVEVKPYILNPARAFSAKWPRW
jgi:hypothetical protein